MAKKAKRVTLIYNENAGSAGDSQSDIVDMIERVGFSVTCYSKKKRDLEKALDEPADIIAVAGGDGAVAKVAAQMRPNGCPIAVLPLGTANNIAKSLGIGQPGLELIASWHTERMMAFYPIAAAGPWGRSRIIEGIGFGAIEQAIAELPSKTTFPNARNKYAEAALNAPAEELKLRVDDEPGTGKFTMLEITKFPFVGPNLPVAAGMDSSEPKFALCSVEDDAKDRERLAKWFAKPHEAEVPVKRRTAGRLEVTGRFRQMRIEGKLWRNQANGKDADAAQVVVLETEPEPLFFLVSQ